MSILNILGHDVLVWYSYGSWHIKVDFGSCNITTHRDTEPGQLEIEKLIIHAYSA